MKRMLTATIMLGATLAFSGFAKDLVDPVNKDRKGVAIEGYDPVAYFKESRAVKGSPDFSHSWKGATWLFASAQNRDLFALEPTKYEPQFGGYCSWAVSQGYTAGIDPGAWKIVDGRLYLNYSKGVQRKWEENLQERIADANRNWPGLHK